MSSPRWRSVLVGGARALRRVPILRPGIERAQEVVWRVQLRSIRSADESSTDPLALLRPDPWEIREGLWRLDLLAELGVPHQRLLLGLVRAGDWDRRRFEIESLGIFEAIRLRFAEGVPWREIPYFEEMRRSVEAGEPRFKYWTVDDIPRQWRRIDRLFERIEREGLRTQRELGTRRPWDEVVVAIGRDGHLLFLNGRHRLAIARVLDLPAIPVLVGVRHRDRLSPDTSKRSVTPSGIADGRPSHSG